MKRDKSRESARNDQKALKVFTPFHWSYGIQYKLQII